MDVSVRMVISHMLDLRLSLTHGLLPSSLHTIRNITIMSPVVHAAKSYKKNYLRKDFSVWMAISHMLEIKLSLTHGPLPLPHYMI